MRRSGLLVAAAVVVLTNGVVLLEVAHNRARAVETIQMMERELPLTSPGKEDTGISVHLHWLRLDYIGSDYSWLDRSKLQELGFDLARAKPDPLHLPSPRPAFIALETTAPHGRNGGKRLLSRGLEPTPKYPRASSQSTLQPDRTRCCKNILTVADT
jgi:hypothetical protein